MAILSLVFGIVGLVLAFIPIIGLFAILLVVPRSEEHTSELQSRI